ncbi:hypothetical protein ACFX2J_042997 [Malus domestica]
MNVCCVLSPSPSNLTGKSAPSRVMDSKLPCDVGDHKLAASNLCGTVLSVDSLYSFGKKGKGDKSHPDTVPCGKGVGRETVAKAEEGAFWERVGRKFGEGKSCVSSEAEGK